LKIQRLTLRDFRNLHATDFLPEEKINILCGENGHGKTNLLESIYILSNLSSFRPAPLRDMILYGAEYSRIEGHILCQEVQKEISVFFTAHEKSVKVNGKGISRAVDYFGELAVILFSPETLKLVQGGPEFRRRFMDRAISRIDRNYLLDLKEYKKILEQRNKLLRFVQEGRVQKGDLQVWSEQLARTGSRICRRRFLYLAELAPACSEVFRDLLHKKDKTADLQILYRSTLFRRSPIEPPSVDLSELNERYRDGLKKFEAKEIRNGATMIGPHLDDLIFLMEDRPVKTVASQGEMRVLALSLALGEALLYQEKMGIFPVLLLDDVNSELDRRRQEILSEYLLRLGQVFLTTTDDRAYTREASSARVFQVRRGEIFLEKNMKKM
jgi:DNA replication and repair protein RecF